MKSPKPILTSLLQVYGVLAGFLCFAAGVIAVQQNNPQGAIIAFVAGFANVLLAFGLGQVVSYLAEAAFHGERSANALERMAATAKPGVSLPRSIVTMSSADPDIEAHLAAKRARGEV